MGDLSYIRPYHREIARRLVLCQSISEIAASVGISATRIGVLAKSPLFKLELKKLEDMRDKQVVNVQETFSQLAPVAIDTIERLMYKGSTETMQFKAAESILDRGGHGAISRGKVEIEQNIRVQHSELTDRELRDLIMKRVQKVVTEEKEVKKRDIEMDAIDVDFEEAKQAVPKLPLGVF